MLAAVADDLVLAVVAAAIAVEAVRGWWRTGPEIRRALTR